MILFAYQSWRIRPLISNIFSLFIVRNGQKSGPASLSVFHDQMNANRHRILNCKQRKNCTSFIKSCLHLTLSRR